MTFKRWICGSNWNAWLRFALVSLCLALAACGARVDLMGAVQDDEANDVMAALLKASIPAEKTSGKDGMVGVRVSSDQVGRALEVLRENGLPRERYAGMGQIFKKEGLISSPLEERARYLFALSQELGSTISKIDGVLAARVHVVLPERGTAGDAGLPSTAAVFIKYQDGFNLEIIQPQIRRLVTNSIPGLTADRVTVILIPSLIRSTASIGAQVATEQVWGMTVAADSARALSITLWCFLAAVALSLVAVAYLTWRFVLPKSTPRRPGSVAV